MDGEKKYLLEIRGDYKGFLKLAVAGAVFIALLIIGTVYYTLQGNKTGMIALPVTLAVFAVVETVAIVLCVKNARITLKTDGKSVYLKGKNGFIEIELAKVGHVEHYAYGKNNSADRAAGILAVITDSGEEYTISVEHAAAAADSLRRAAECAKSVK